LRAAIQQPHYFPWVGYFDKMAKVDLFIFMDEVQMEDRSYMLRNRFLKQDGTLSYLSVTASKKGYREKKYNEIGSTDIEGWTARHMNVLQNYYRKAKYREEIFPLLEAFFQSNYSTVCQWACASINLIRELLRVKTPLVYQSDIDYDRNNKRSDLIYAICKAVHADIYFAGRGASIEYLDREKFEKNGVKIAFQEFQHPRYPQCNSTEFVPGISVLDMLFNCGIQETRRIFWENVNNTREFEEIEA